MPKRNGLILLGLLALLLISAAPITYNLAPLTIVNKSGRQVVVTLSGTGDENREESYVLTIPRGSKREPTTRKFTIIPGMYRGSIEYVEIYDPVYGYSCSDRSVPKINASRVVRLTIMPCQIQLPKHGEPSMLKY